MRPFVVLVLFSLSAASAETVSRGLALADSAAAIEAPIRFRAAAFRAAGPIDLRVRASRDGADWTEWTPVVAEDAGAGRMSGLVYFGGPYRYLQTDGARAGVEWFPIDPGASPQPRPKGQRAAQSAPPVVSREQWGCSAQACPVKDAPAYTTVTHLIVHHTAGANSASDWPAVVRSIWELHVKVNGWNDIGYNFLIDPTGVVYEGRAGGDGVLGAHFSGVNSGTLGVSVLGTYTSTPLPDAAYASLRALLAWKAERWGVDPAGRSLHAASGLVLNHISGHRDAGLSPRATSTTECPGNAVFALLPGLRAEVRRALDGACPVTVSPLSRCVGPEAGAVEIALTAPAGCALDLGSRVDWLTAESTPAGLRVRVAANSGARRTGAVTAAGRSLEITQSAAGEPPLPCLAPGGVVAAAGGDPRPVVAGSLLSFYGERLAPAASAASTLPLPTSLGGVQVSVNGRAVPLLYVGPDQINALLPAGVATGTARAAVTSGGVTGPESNFSVTEAVPALFLSAGRAIAANFEDGKRNGPDAPARAGAVVTVWATGAGPVQGGFPAAGAANPGEARRASLPASASVGGRLADILYLGLAPGFSGVYQCDLRLPAELPPGDHALVLTVSGVASLAGLIAVMAP